MKLYFYRGVRPNFGDELNWWMWPKIFGDVFDQSAENLFLGIGSILFSDHPKEMRKIVFGSGYGGYTSPPVIDKKWDVRFLRGKFTAKALGLDDGLAVGDSAILLRSVVDYAAPHKKVHKFSYMPHWESAEIGLWKDVCELIGINYIDPCGEIEFVLKEILSSETVITEAMHGAIVSDALRVPWIAAKPIHESHRAKWDDWASVLDLKIRMEPILPSGLLELLISKIGQRGFISSKLQFHGKSLNGIRHDAFVIRAAEQLQKVARTMPQLSPEAAIQRAHQRMLDEVDRLRRDYPELHCQQ
ncbi:polysaccharide pyruvyl transferase family protein [Roseateles asaccharophilus]|uniref:Succinoglycan biosynthesis protein ExoV n=1 Tax=Roseateles asaccharophilus TaxID=582607 RepID=A0ABU2ACA2_9BURK|nr:polysaccharide pyruvyl transferase family protein [Roseateles asaccharophilus]MDR7334834.1 succinoglycan biosynthesis protein ExoV [Roseateles asaccharophilus]